MTTTQTALMLSADGDWDLAIRRSLQSGRAFPANKVDYDEAKEGRRHAMWVFAPESAAEGLAAGCPEAIQRALMAHDAGAADALRADLWLGDGNALVGAIPLAKVQYGAWPDQDAERPGTPRPLYYALVIFDAVAPGASADPTEGGTL